MFGSTFILLICLLILLFKYLTVERCYWKRRNIKQVNGLIWRFVTEKRPLPEIFKAIYDDHPNLPHVGTFLFKKNVLVLREIGNIQAVLHGDFHSFYSRGMSANTSDVLADNLFFVDDYKRWKLIRQKLSPEFTIAKLKNIFYITEKCARDFIDYIEYNPEIIEKPLNAIYTYTTACISRAILGMEKETANKNKTIFGKISYNSVKPCMKLNLVFLILNTWPKIYKLLNIKAFGHFQGLFVNIIEKILERRRNDKTVYYDFINTCMKFADEGKLNDFVTGYETDVNTEFLAAQAFIFLLGGIDTTANATHFALLELSNNPKVLKKVHEEIDEIFNKNNGTLRYEDIGQLEYMEMVINETLRKYPPIASIHRKCHKDTVLPVGEVKIEKDTIIIIPTYALHTDEKYFPNPDEFNPDRFSTENKSKIVKFSYLPFGEGKRNCIGVKLALLEMKVGLAWLLRKYTIKQQTYTPKNFELSYFSLRDPNSTYELILRT